MNIKKLAIYVLITFLWGCTTPYYQLVETKTTNTKVVDDNYVFENDSIKVTYNFWLDRGILNFTIYNKLKKPLYIDWKKSSYINNSIKMNYWNDEASTKTISEYESSSFIFLGSRDVYSKTNGISSSLTTKPEIITFVPPNSNYTRKQFYLTPKSFIKIPVNSYRIEKIPAFNDPEKQATLYVKDFQKDESPLVFRNFITFSFSDKFDQEFYLDHEFYISRVTKMEKKQLGKYKVDKKTGNIIRDEDGRFKIFSHYEKGTSYYVYMYAK
jgi:hypothetical protein